MTITIRLPEFTETVVEGIVEKWLKQEGDWVEEEEPLVEIVTDKVTVEMPSPAAGRLARIIAPESAIVAVGGDLAILEEAAEEPSDTGSPPTAPPQQAAAQQGPSADQKRGRRYSPIVRRLAEEHSMDLEQVPGTGIGGRVTREDVLAYLAGLEGTAGTGTSAPAEDEEEIVITPIRRLIADHMVRSVQTSPHAWAVLEVDVTDLVALRKSLREQFEEEEGVSLTYLPFAVKAAAEGLKENPMLNSTWAGDRIILKKRIHIGMAVATDEGLVVPVIKDADTKSIKVLAREIADLTTRAREGRLSLDAVSGGTFTVNNSGALGTLITMPIINQPQVAILNMDAIVKRPVVVERDAIAVRSMMHITVAFDHRILDGAAAASFLRRVKARLESYGPSAALD